MVSAGSHILLVEDDRNTQLVERHILEREGYIVATAASGEEGLDALASTTPDLVLLDVTLPGIDGFVTCHRIRAFSQVPVIMVTSKYLSEDRVRGLEAGADGYIAKPFTPQELAASARAALRRIQARSVSSRPSSQPPKGPLDPGKVKVYLSGKEVYLSGVEYRLFHRIARGIAHLHFAGNQVRHLVGRHTPQIRPYTGKVRAQDVSRLVRAWRSALMKGARDPEYLRAGLKRLMWSARTLREGPVRQKSLWLLEGTRRYVASWGIQPKWERLWNNLWQVHVPKIIRIWQHQSTRLVGYVKGRLGSPAGAAPSDNLSVDAAATPSSPTAHEQVLGPQPETPGYNPEAFLQTLYDAYLKYLEEGGNEHLEFASVVPLVDIFPMMTMLHTPGEEYSKETFARDVYQLHVSGVNTTQTGAMISFPISRGVPGKVLYGANEVGAEFRYYGVRFLRNEEFSAASRKAGDSGSPEGSNHNVPDPQRPYQELLSEEEKRGLYFIKALLYDMVDVKRIGIRQHENYSAILLDNNLQKQICRLRVAEGQKFLGLMDEEGRERKIAIDDMDDLLTHAKQLKRAARRCHPSAAQT